LWFLSSPFFINQTKPIQKQTTRDYLSITKQYSIFVILPPIEIQKKIVKKLDDIFEKLEEKKKEIFTIIEKKQCKN